ncbi:hypothetical protein M9H77_03350 [Catharanthus roseus]|uniref:Uncharacterized protein n=1 Tax=Catharanthus roseus TaxID=4058 RepID=A0ACC0CB88_CATRO|nr:hypothetical protein M9H77_03350 [Catharanthus roseus]
MRECDLSGFLSIKKTTQTGIVASSLQPNDEGSEDDKSYDLSRKDVPSTVPMTAFQNEMWTALEQLRVTQNIHEVQLAETVESTPYVENVNVLGEVCERNAVRQPRMSEKSARCLLKEDTRKKGWLKTGRK